MARKIGTTAPKNDLHGLLALMLCEALLHVLVERRVITKKSALEAIDTVAEVTREIAERGKRPAPVRARRGSGGAKEALAVIEGMRASFDAKS